MTELEQKLQQMLDKVERKIYLDRMVEQMLPQRATLREKCLMLENDMYREDRDVQNLEGNSITGFFLDIFGKREERLEKEKQEAYSARMKYNAAKYELDSIDRLIDSYSRELESLKNSESELQSVLDAHMSDIGNESNIALQVQLSLLKGKKLEMEEAIEAGHKVIACADTILSYLDKADSWSTADFFLDSFLVDMAKHDNIDKATTQINNLQTLLGRFRSELADVTIDKNISINIDSFTTFADYFWDGIFSNMEVQRKISDATKQVQGVKYKVQDAISTLTLMINENNLKQQQTQRKMK